MAYCPVSASIDDYLNEQDALEAEQEQRERDGLPDFLRVRCVTCGRFFRVPYWSDKTYCCRVKCLANGVK